jgi:hypothetical protein
LLLILACARRKAPKLSNGQYCVGVGSKKKQTQAVGSQKVRNNHIQSRKAGAASAAFDIIPRAPLCKREYISPIVKTHSRSCLAQNTELNKQSSAGHRDADDAGVCK